MLFVTIKCEQRIIDPIIPLGLAPDTCVAAKREIEFFFWKVNQRLRCKQNRFQNGFNDVVWHICVPAHFSVRAVIDGFLFNKNELRLHTKIRPFKLCVRAWREREHREKKFVFS